MKYICLVYHDEEKLEAISQSELDTIVLDCTDCLDARDLNEAIQLAAGLAAANGASIEVRPLLEPDLVLTDALDRKIGAAMQRTMQDEPQP